MIVTHGHYGFAKIGLKSDSAFRLPAAPLHAGHPLAANYSEIPARLYE